MNTATLPQNLTHKGNPRRSYPAQRIAHDAITLRLRYDDPEEAVATSSALASLVNAESLPKPFVLTTGNEIIAAFVLKDTLSPLNLDQLTKALTAAMQAQAIRGEVRTSRMMTSDTAVIAQMWVALRALLKQREAETEFGGGR